MKFNKKGIIRLAVCLIFIFIFTRADAQDSVESEDDDLMSMSFDVEFELGQENNDQFLLIDNPFKIVFRILTFTDEEFDAVWTIRPDALVQTEVNTYENYADELSQETLSYEIWIDDMLVKNLTGELLDTWIRIVADNDGRVTHISIDVSANPVVLSPLLSMVREPLLIVDDMVTDNMDKGDKVTLVGFGTFQVKSRRTGRTGRNPQTGEEIQIKASNVALFKAGKALKDAVN